MLIITAILATKTNPPATRRNPPFSYSLFLALWRVCGESDFGSDSSPQRRGTASVRTGQNNHYPFVYPLVTLTSWRRRIRAYAFASNARSEIVFSKRAVPTTGRQLRSFVSSCETMLPGTIQIPTLLPLLRRRTDRSATGGITRRKTD
jgi:hypothetical protein